jgi:hypothetical protein
MSLRKWRAVATHLPRPLRSARGSLEAASIQGHITASPRDDTGLAMLSCSLFSVYVRTAVFLGGEAFLHALPTVLQIYATG